jgi:hypothetical protein
VSPARVVKRFSVEVDLESIARMIAYRAVEDVLASPMERLRICQGQNCSWLFLDRSKGGRRRWCDMAVCGNAAKSRRFYARKGGGFRYLSSQQASNGYLGRCLQLRPIHLAIYRLRTNGYRLSVRCAFLNER